MSLKNTLPYTLLRGPVACTTETPSEYCPKGIRNEGSERGKMKRKEY